MPRRILVLVVLGLVAWPLVISPPAPSADPADATLQVGFGETDITPPLGGKPVYLAGFGQNRKATGVHDPLMARAVVMQEGTRKIALVSVDLVGFFHPEVMKVRKNLPGFTYVLVTSTHNHEGPDTLGLWGPRSLQSGVNPEYMEFVDKQIVQAVEQAAKAVKPVRAQIGMARAPELLHDGREPYIKHDELGALMFADAATGKTVGLVVQWNCHPETLGSENTLVSADFVGPVVKYLKSKYQCPVVYLTGTVGGLMTSLHVEVKDEQGKNLKDGTFEKTDRYGYLLGKVADQAVASARPVRLTPMETRQRTVYLPLENKLYLLAHRLRVIDRDGFLWAGDANQAKPAGPEDTMKPLCIRSEIGWLRLGELEIAAIPGEIYPELVLDKVQDPVDPGADFPLAPIEPAIYKQMRGPYRLMIGLANDEVGYIIPKRQWDEKPPFCYGRQKTQYGEVSSLGPETAPILCKAFQDLVKDR
jgi:hypothetical protein